MTEQDNNIPVPQPTGEPVGPDASQQQQSFAQASPVQTQFIDTKGYNQISMSDMTPKVNPEQIPNIVVPEQVVEPTAEPLRVDIPQQPESQPAPQQSPVVEDSVFGQDMPVPEVDSVPIEEKHASPFVPGIPENIAAPVQPAERQPVPPTSEPPTPPLPRNEHYDDEPSGNGGKKMVSMASAAILAVVVGVASWGGTMIANNFFGHSGNTTTITEIVNSEDLENQENSQTLANAVAKKAMPSVVCIYTYTDKLSYQDMYSLFMSGKTPESINESEPQLSGLGSGIIISDDGYILTNYHVIENADSLKISIDGKAYEGKIVGSDPTSDIAVVKVDATGLPAITPADSSKLEIGDWVMAIGAPYGYEETCTTGIISALARATALQGTNETTIYANLIQTDAAINSGNSGGALVDASGNLIGMNTLISSTSGASAGIGFAIPSNYAMDVAKQIIDNGSVKHAQLGVVVSQTEDGHGALVTSVEAESSAAESGIQKGDIITEVDGNTVTTPSDVVYAVRGHLVGDEMNVKFMRDGVEHELTITLGDDGAIDATVQQSANNAQNGQGNGYGNGYGQNGQGQGNGGSSWEDLFKYFMNR